MKKLVSILMVLVMCASLAACGDSGSTVSNTPSSAPSSAPSNTGGPTDAQEGGEVAVSNEELEALAAAYNEVAVVFNEIYTTAESNGWLEDEETVIELQALTDMLTSINTGLTEDPSVFEGVDINSMIEELQNLGPELESLYNRVSYHYEDGK